MPTARPRALERVHAIADAAAGDIVAGRPRPSVDLDELGFDTVEELLEHEGVATTFVEVRPADAPFAEWLRASFAVDAADRRYVAVMVDEGAAIALFPLGCERDDTSYLNRWGPTAAAAAAYASILRRFGIDAQDLDLEDDIFDTFDVED